MTETPQAQAARQYMTHKGLGDEEPVDIQKLDGQDCWYFTYELPEGDLELEVFWDEPRMEWQMVVTTFTLAN